MASPVFGAKDAEPVRYFQFKYAGDQPVESLLSYESFLQKNAPGLDGLPHRYAVADALIAKGQFEEASKILRQLVDIPQVDNFLKASVLLKLADSLMHQNLYQQAVQFYTQASNAGVRSVLPEATIGLAMAQVATGDREHAFTRFQELVAFYPAYKNHPRYMFPLGLIQWEVRRYEGALEYFLRDEKNPASLYFAGLCYRAMKRIPDAIATFRRISEEFPQTPWADRARFEVGETFYQQKDWPLAAQTFTDIHKARPSVEWETLAFYRLACTEFQLKNFKAAEEKFSLLAHENKDPSLLPNVTYLLSETLAEQKKVPRLIGILEEVQRSKRRSVDNMYRLVWAYTAEGQYEKAVGLANDFMNTHMDPDLTPRALLVQAYAFEKQGKTPEAMAGYQLIVEKFPATPYAARATQLSAMNYYRGGQFKSVTTHVKSLWNSVDESARKKYPETLYWMAQAHLKLRQSEHAQRMFQEFTRTAPPRHPWMASALRAQALASAMGKSPEAALPVLQRAYQNAQDIEDRSLMAKLALDMANISYNGKKFERAAGFYRQIEQIDPKNPQVPFAYYQGGVALHRAEYYGDAIESWVKLVKEFPKDPRAPEALFRASKTHFDMAKYPEAVNGYQELIRNYPTSDYLKDAYIQMGQAHFNAKDYKRAIEVYKEFLARFPRDPQSVQVSQLLDAARLKDGVPLAQIEAENNRGGAKNPVLADAYWEQGAKHYNAKEYDKAREFFEKLVYNFPNSSLAAQAAFYRAEALFLQKKYPEAATAYTSFVESYRDDPQRNLALFHLAVSRFNEASYAKAAEAFEMFAQGFPTDPLAGNALLNAALSYIRAQDAVNAQEAADAFASAHPQHEDLGGVFLQLGQFLEKTSREADATKAYYRVPRGRAERPEALYNAARVFRSVNNLEDERKAYEELRDMGDKDNPYRIAGMLQLADLYLLQNKMDEGLTALRDVMKNAPDPESRDQAKQRLAALGAG